MATFPNVSPGQAWKPIAELENKLRHIVNESQAITSNARIISRQSSRISVFNVSNVEIPAGSAVNFDDAQEIDHDEWIIPCVPFSDMSKAWGILTDTLDVEGIGSCIISGPAKIKISNGDGAFVQPDINTPDVFNPANNGVPIVFRQGSEAIINLGGGSSGVGVQESYQFKVIDTSEYLPGGTSKLQVSVANGHNTNADVAGYLNGVAYAKTPLEISKLLKFYIYAINGQIYSLGHTFSSDLIPVLLLATVEIVDGTLKIEQASFADNVIVPVAPRTHGATTLTCELSYKDYSLTAAYYVEALAYLNSTELTMTKRDIPYAESGALYAYIKDVVIQPDAKPDAGFEFTVPEDAKFTRAVLQYQLSDSEFRINSRTSDLYFFTFTKIFLNASESGE